MQCSLWPIPVLPTCNVRKKKGILRWFCSGRVTSGKDETAGIIKEWLVEVEEACFVEVWVHTVDVLTLIRTEKGRFSVRIGECITT